MSPLRLVPFVALAVLAAACEDPELVDVNEDRAFLPPSHEDPTDPDDDEPDDDEDDPTDPDGEPTDPDGEVPGDPEDPAACAIADCGSWREVGVLDEPRSRHTATRLRDGRVLIAGGQTEALTASCEIYDPETESFVPAADLGGVRYDHAAALLEDGRVLVAGGFGTSEHLATAELYDPETDTWAPVGPLTQPRSSHTATVLDDGSVLIAGGINGAMEAEGQPLALERFVPESETFVHAGYLNGWRYLHKATALADGRVFITGGFRSPTEYPLDTLLVGAEDLTPGTALSAPRRSHTATLLPSGDVLLAGGFAQSPLGTASIFVTGESDYRQAGTLVTSRHAHTATSLQGGEVLIAGGLAADAATAAAELYDPVTEAFVALPAMHEARHSHTATRLEDGSILVVGGSVEFEVLGGAEIFTP